ncbi:Crp/Fnr family transcriptional regulator [Cryptosporangium arvum]|uniref:Crp/Fnr family transcriptional regulator n=1 Tax=Cryptosporangium arvum TaxID=80871 RepID=UPI0005608BDF|nr:Crp/Fnr family transcriptional regulator [Cryptosporangium arvum]
MSQTDASGDSWLPGSFLGRLEPAVRAQILSTGVRRRFEAGQVLLHQDDLSTHVYLLVSGVVKVTVGTAGGRTIFLSVRTAGEVVGELAATDDGPRTATVTACGVVHAREINVRDWRELLATRSSASAALHFVLTERLRAATSRRIELGEHPASVRVARILAYFVRRYGERYEHGWELTFPLTQPELAAAAECSLTSTQGALRELRLRGVIETRYRWFVVRDLVALEDHAGLD